MKSLSSWLIAMFAFMFWGFRVVTTVLYSMGTEFIAEPMDMTMEVVLLFITFVCICFITKRKLLPTIIYLIASTINSYMSLLVALIGIVIPLFAFFDVLLDKNRKAHPVDKQTDWFYKNEEYDRKVDERSDRNQYRTM